MGKRERHHNRCTRGRYCTLYNGPPAAVCRLKRWTVGDVLEGDEGYGPERITITAIGEGRILARGDDGYENLWTLSCRCWRKVGNGWVTR